MPNTETFTMDELLREHGSLLYDYCLTELSPADAELAACGALVSAIHHADQPREDEQSRAWLYALARAHRTAQANPASVGSWTRPDSTADPLLAEALMALPGLHREVLDLAVRHHLTHPEIALIFDVGAVEIERLATVAADQLETWVAAVTAARGDGCSELGGQVSETADAPARRRRVRISRHISQCPTCQNAPRTTTAGELLDHLPIMATPATMTGRLAGVEPLAPEEGWRADGFPPQTHALAETLADLPSPALTSNSPPASEDEFRAWERNGDDFWARREDESDPEARLSLRPFLPAIRVSVLIAGAVACVLGAGAGWSALQPERPSPAVPVAAPATITLVPSDVPPNALLDEPPPVPPPSRRPRSPAPSKKRTPMPAPKNSPSKARSQIDPATGGSRADTNSGPQEPPAWPARDPSASSTRRPLPRPAPPTADLTLASLHLGAGRSGRVTLSCTGTCHITSGRGTSGIVVDGDRITVSAPTSTPACDDITESGTATITWSGTSTGDGRTSEGTTRSDGILTLPVSWTIEADKGTWIPTGSVAYAGDHEGRWSNCP
ncbi:RNA polymerase sigma factor [Nonomuraea fuscirosea]|uniref:RNA polymerase sigma factor n=1 Tax=Nonomuraea fuscirosea TaxID=1291556 RepID=UPI00340EC34F